MKPESYCNNNVEITNEVVENIAHLAKIKLEKDEASAIKNELFAILNYMDVLNGLNTEEIEPITHVFDLCNVMRDDIAKQSFDVEDIVKNAPVHTADSFVVPKTVE